MKKKIAIALLMIMMPFSAFALTDQERDTLLLQLLQELIAIRQQFAATLAQTTPPVSSQIGQSEDIGSAPNSLLDVEITSPDRYDEVEYGDFFTLQWDADEIIEDDSKVHIVLSVEGSNGSGTWRLRNSRGETTFDLKDESARVTLDPQYVSRSFVVGQKGVITIETVRNVNKKKSPGLEIEVLDNMVDRDRPSVEIEELDEIVLGEPTEISWEARNVEEMQLKMQIHPYNDSRVVYQATLSRGIEDDRDSGDFRFVIPNNTTYSSFKDKKLQVSVYTFRDGGIADGDPLAVRDTWYIQEGDRDEKDDEVREVRITSHKDGNTISTNRQFMLEWELGNTRPAQTYIDLVDSKGNALVLSKLINLSEERFGFFLSASQVNIFEDDEVTLRIGGARPYASVDLNLHVHREEFRTTEGKKDTIILSSTGERLFGSNYDIPAQSFDGYYMDGIHAKKKNGNTDHVYYSYVKALDGYDGHYWVGSFAIEANTNHYFQLSDPSRGSAKLYIDGTLVRSGGGIYKHSFREAGDYTIEVVYEGRWHAGTFAMGHTLLEDDDSESFLGGNTALLTSAASLRSSLDNVMSFYRDPRVSVVSVYEAKSDEGVVEVNMPETKTRDIVVLSSYEPVRWDLNGLNDSGASIKVFIVSHRGGSSITSDSNLDVTYVKNTYLNTSMKHSDLVRELGIREVDMNARASSYSGTEFTPKDFTITTTITEPTPPQRPTQAASMLDVLKSLLDNMKR